MIDMYNMIGTCSKEIILASAPFALRNLGDASDKELQLMQKEALKVASKDLFGFNEELEGVILHSGSEANELALLIAKKKSRKNIVLSTNISHTSISNACDKLGMELIKIDVNKENLQINIDELINILKKRGDEIALINATYGTTYFGNTEDFIFNKEIEELCKKHDIWVHLDSAYGGTILNLLDNPNKKLIQKSSIIKSISLDSSKFIGAICAAIFLFRDKEDKKVITKEASYFKGNMTYLGTTRSAFPLATFLKIIDKFKLRGLKELANECNQKAIMTSKLLISFGYEMLSSIDSGVVSIKCNSESEQVFLKNELFKKGFKVSPISIFGKNYTIYGIRIVVTPKEEVKQDNLNKFIEAMKDLKDL